MLNFYVYRIEKNNSKRLCMYRNYKDDDDGEVLFDRLKCWNLAIWVILTLTCCIDFNAISNNTT